MAYEFKILAPDNPTQYPHQMAKESRGHRFISKFSYPQKLDYFATIKPAELKVNTGDCGNTNGTVSTRTSCPSDHVPIYMDYVFKEIEIRVISWNIQYFLSNYDGNILGILKGLTQSKDNFIILLQEIKGKTQNTNYDNIETLIKSLLSNPPKKNQGHMKEGFQATIYSFKDDVTVRDQCINIQRCLLPEKCIKIDSESGSESEQDKYSSLLLIFEFPDKKFLLVNNVHLASFNSAKFDRFRFTEFNHIITRNKKIIRDIGIKNYEIIFGGDMNTNSFKNFKELKPDESLLDTNNLPGIGMSPLTSTYNGSGKTNKRRKKRNNQKKKTLRRLKFKPRNLRKKK